MAEETQLESGQSGEQELPTPSFSEQATSSTSTGADEIVSKLTPVLEQLVERKLQSVKDKRISKLEEGQSSVLAALEEMGVQVPKEVRQEMRLRELEGRIAQQSAQPVQKSDAGPSDQKTATTEALAELKEAGLEVDADVIAILRGQYQNRAAFDLAIQKHINKKLRPQKPASVADVVQSPATARTTDKSVEALTDEYKQKVKAARGNRSEITRLRNEYAQKGVKVHEVDFS